MIPPQSKFNRVHKIPAEILNKINNPNSYWVVSWLGKSFFSDDRIHRELFITNVNGKNHFYNHHNRTFKTSMPEEKIIHFPLGTYLEYSGHILNHPNLEKGNYIEEIKNVILNPETDYNDKGLFSILSKNSWYPIYENENDKAYEGASFYNLIHEDSLQIIIPISVIQSYFYYLSTLCIYHIIYGIQQKAIFRAKDKEGNGIIAYNSSIIREKEASILSKYYFIEGNGTKALNEIHDTFFTKLNNAKKFNANDLKFYLEGKVPYDEQLNLSVIGKKIGKDKFIVYRIKDFNLVSGNSKFLVDNYNILDISDRTSLKQENQNIVSTISSTKDLISHPLQITDNETNHNFNIIDTATKSSKINNFFDSPLVYKIPKKSQENLYKADQILFNSINEISENIRNNNNKSKSARVNYNIDGGIDYIQVIFDTIKSLNNDKDFETDYLFIEETENENTTYPPIGLEIVGELILASIIYKDYNYCLVVSLGIKRRMGLLKNNIQGIRFEKKKDPILQNILIYMINNYKLTWDFLKQGDELHKFGATLEHNFNYKVLETHDETVENLTKRIKDFYKSKAL